jgi:hypothetical protein
MEHNIIPAESRHPANSWDFSTENERLATTPGAGDRGKRFVQTTPSAEGFWNGTAWVLAGKISAPKAVSASSYTLLASDDVIDFTGGGATSVTVPLGLPTSFELAFTVSGAGTVTFVPASGVTMLSTNAAATAPTGTSGALIGTSTANSLRLLNGAPAVAGTARTFRGAVADQAAMLATSTAVAGDWVVRSDLGIGYELTATPASTLANWRAYATSTRVDRGAVADQAAMLALSGAAVGNWVQRTDLGGIGYELTSLPATTLGNWKAYAPAVAAGSGLPTAIAFSTTVPLDGFKDMGTVNQTGDITFTVGPVVNRGRCTVVINGDSSHAVNLTAFTALSTSQAFDNTKLNGITFEYQGGIPTYTLRQLTAATLVNWLLDTFDGTAGTELSAHTPNVGGTWGPQPGFSPGAGSTTVLDGTGGMQSRSTGNGAVQNSQVPPSGSYTLEATFHKYSTIASEAAEVSGHASTSGDTCIYFQWVEASGVFRLGHRVSGANTILQTSSATTWADGTEKVLRLQLTISGSDTLAAGFVDGVQVGTTQTISTASLQGPGRAGLRQSLPQTATTGIHCINLRGF